MYYTKPRLHDTTGCQSGCITGLTTVLNEQTVRSELVGKPAPNFLEMGIKMPRFVVFWTTSTIKDEKSAAKFHYIKTVIGRVVAHSIAFRVVSIYWQGNDPFPP